MLAAILTLICGTIVVNTGCGSADSGNADRKALDIHTEDDISGLSVAALTGSVYDFELSARDDVTLYRYSTTADCIEALRSGKVDAYLDDEISVSPTEMKRHNMRIAFKKDDYYDVGFAFRKQDAPLVAEFNKYLAAAKQSGLFEEMNHRWFDTDSPDRESIPPLPEINEGEVLRVGTITTNAPITFLRGKDWQGYEAEVVKRFAQYLGRPIEIKLYDTAAAPAALQTGIIDLWMGCIFITEERQKSMAFSDSHYACHPAYYILDSETAEGHGLFSWEGLKDSFYSNLVYEDRWMFIVDGLKETIVISLWSLLLGTLLGCIVCWMRMCRFRWINGIAKCYIELLRGIPLLVFLMIMYYLVLATSGLSATMIAVLAFSMVFAAYTSEMFRTAVEGVSHGQTEAGIALGFTPLQTFLFIVAPQAIRSVMPVYKGEAVSLFKNTSIVGYIAIQDLTKASDLIRSRTFDAFFPLIIVTIIYFILAWLLGLLLDLAAKKA